MVLSSHQISELNGAYQHQHMQQMQNAAMLGSAQHGFSSGAERGVGSAMNAAAAIGSPLAGLAGMGAVQSAGMGMFGLARGVGMGFGGAVGMGAGAAMGVAAPLMAASYAGGQVFQGAQQQQGFNTMMRAQYQFANPQGGAGFSRGDLGGIGSSMRQMSTQQGPMGEMVGFEELGRLASNMGRMGMSQGVRDAKEFTDKFKQMVKSLKEIATEMGTSLEEAQKLMGGMRQSGVFGATKASQFAGLIRGGAQAGGLATSELTGMMSIGSQISRSIGGRGSQGARGGLETITNIGVAQQMGVISEEDIYNSTGLTGAEGRRAMATQQMSQSAQFLKGQLGRRFLAAVAGKDGKLNEGAAEEFMAGGVGTGRTMELAQKNLSQVGRANFIRNEGRLRGAALEKFGGLASTMVMRGWLEQRGINVDEDSDRAMIFMQRKLGMGRDEADMNIRQARALPQMLRERQHSAEEDRFSRGMAERRAGQGIEGVKKKFESARADVQAGLQDVGADFYQQMSEMTERFVNKLTGDYVQTHRKDVSRLMAQSRQGGATGRAAFERAFGKGIVSDSLMGSALNTTKMGGMDLGGGGASGLSGFEQSQMVKQGNWSRVQGQTGEGLQKSLQSLDAMSNAFQTGGAGLADRDELMQLAQQNKSGIRGMFLSGEVSGKGAERFDRMQAGVQRMGGKLAQRLSAAKTEAEKAQIMAAVTEGAGVEGEADMFQSPDAMTGLFSGNQFATTGEKHQAIGERLFGREKGGSTGVFGSTMSKLFGNKRNVSREMATAAGQYFDSEGGRDVLAKSLSSDSSTRAGARETLENDLKSLRDKGDELTDEDKGRMSAVRAMLLAQEKAELKQQGFSDDEVHKRLAERGKELGVSADNVERVADLALSARHADITQAQKQAQSATRRVAAGRLVDMTRRGLLQRDKEGKMTLSAEGSKKAGAGADFIKAMVGRESVLAAGGAGTQGEIDATEKMRGLREGMSVEQKRSLAQEFGEELSPEERSNLMRQANIQSTLGKAGGGVAGRQKAIAGMLGVKLTDKELKGGDEAVSKLIGEGAGISSAEGLEEIKAALSASRDKGGLGKAAGSLDRLLDPIQKQQELQRSKQAEKDDPLGKERNDKLSSIDKTSTHIHTQLMGISAKLDKKAEDED